MLSHTLLSCRPRQTKSSSILLRFIVQMHKNVFFFSIFSFDDDVFCFGFRFFRRHFFLHLLLFICCRLNGCVHRQQWNVWASKSDDRQNMRNHSEIHFMSNDVHFLVSSLHFIIINAINSKFLWLHRIILQCYARTSWTHSKHWILFRLNILHTQIERTTTEKMKRKFSFWIFVSFVALLEFWSVWIKKTESASIEMAFCESSISHWIYKKKNLFNLCAKWNRKRTLCTARAVSRQSERERSKIYLFFLFHSSSSLSPIESALDLGRLQKRATVRIRQPNIKWKHDDIEISGIRISANNNNLCTGFASNSTRRRKYWKAQKNVNDKKSLNISVLVCCIKRCSVWTTECFYSALASIRRHASGRRSTFFVCKNWVRGRRKRSTASSFCSRQSPVDWRCIRETTTSERTEKSKNDWTINC